MEPLALAPDATEANHRHDHHQDQSDEADEQSAPDPIAVIEEALLRLAEDVGVLAEDAVVQAFAELKTTDMASYLRLRHAAKVANRACSVTLLDQLVRDAMPGGKEETSTLDELVALARAQCQLHHDADRNAIAVLPLPGRREVWRVYSAGFEHWLRAAYWRAKQTGVADTTLKAALATLAAAAINDGSEVAVYTRAAPFASADNHGCGYVIDLANEQWQVAQVTAQGWQILDESPLLFTRTQAMRPLPLPDVSANAGSVELLWQHTNIPPASRLLVLAWLLDCFRPDTPFPVLELIGEQGSAKSTTQAVLRSLVDPSKVMLRGRPKTVEDVFVAAANNWLVSYVNLSSLSAEQQDAFCTLATGGGFAARQLYTNGEEHILETKRPVALNGIALVATRPDLIDRVVHVDLPTIAADARRDDADTHSAWERDKPVVFAGLLTLFSSTLAVLPSVVLSHKQRMADFERLGEAMARSLGFAPGHFQQQYGDSVRAGIDRALESNSVAQALDKYLENRVLPLRWQGTAGQLYELLGTQGISDRSSWPRSPKGLADQLRRIAPAYRAKGIDISHLGHRREGSLWRITDLNDIAPNSDSNKTTTPYRPASSTQGRFSDGEQP